MYFIETSFYVSKTLFITFWVLLLLIVLLLMQWQFLF